MKDENAWDEYDVNVKITVADGKFSDIAVTVLQEKQGQNCYLLLY